MSEQENERYARVDTQGGFLYNKSEIDYFRQTQAIDVMSNLMLGDFNKKGNYVINQGIIDQLVKIKKVYQYSFGSTTFCQSLNDIGGFGKIDFAIKIRNNTQNGITTATLQLLETIDRANGYYQNTNTASIATYSSKDSNTFIIDMLKYFNVVSKKEEGFLKKDINEENVDLVIARKKYEDLLKKGSAEKLDSINKILFEKRLKILGKSEIGKKILVEFNSENYKINGWFVKEGMPGYYRYLNQILDGLFEVHSVEVLQDVALTAAWRKLSENVAVEIAKVMMISVNVSEKTAELTNNQELLNQVKLANENKTNDKKVENLDKKDQISTEKFAKTDRNQEQATKTTPKNPDTNKTQSINTFANQKSDGEILDEIIKGGDNYLNQDIDNDHLTGKFGESLKKEDNFTLNKDLDRDFTDTMGKEL